ncbi:response regulator transcription factor [Providencia sp. PROV188]|jgi:two-component system uhpT operon response regulator UhpA|uniref:LuxR family two component transcriptional regulator n=1 Tax=Providencia alcalifaciens TaxID=126385 RepID=A0A4R3NU02_9GAMM|nr:MULTISPECIES: response regulator transcription factor [Providencia]ETT02423.1 DNA-binding response regulator in two-component regulatory system wtih UhpB [Providencia alcalifaciens PAL-3]EUD00754.1 DNA-binding response regulator in two-component regulatory system wtih UhpB [Providencia alcalifaciens PAL-1]MBC5791084.1 response regulator transcription factor [Providencia sp. JUb39]MBG5882696.1 response regulator transcription factor [Providencia alcalifaciens]MBS0922915.1 response regulator 
MIKIALIDDHIVVRSGFAQLLTLEPDISIVGQYASAQEAWPHLISLDIDVAIMDISMPDESGLQLLTRLRKKKPDFRTIILSIYDTPAFVQSALDAGASAYLTKCCGPEELVQAVRSVYQGGCYLCADAMRALRQTPQQKQGVQELTNREREVFDLLVAGLSVKVIAEQLNLSHKTVHVHRANVLGKLQCENTIDLVHYALEHNIISR